MKKIAIFLVLLLVVNVLPFHASANDQGAETLRKEIGSDLKVIEKGSLFGSEFESTSEGSKVTVRIETGSNVEVIEYDEVSPFFSVTTNGNKVTYDRRDYCVEMFQSENNRRDAFDCTINSTDPYYGSPYYNVLNGQKVITYPFPVTARAYESYTFYRISYVSLYARAFTTISFIVALFSLPWSTVMAVLTGSLAIIDGVYCVTKAVYGSKNETRQRWDKYAIILQDNRVWAEEWKEVDSVITAIDGVTYGPKILETWYTPYFYDILNCAIDRYLNSVPW